MRRLPFAIGGVGLLVAALLLVPRIVPLPDLSTGPEPTYLTIFDRKGDHVSRLAPADGPLTHATRLEEIDPLMIRATLAAEDRRFDSHPGVDPIALLRAVVQALRDQHDLRGASTLTMQVIRLAQGPPKNWTGRVVEVAQAMLLDARMSKDEILELYLNRAPYGGTILGIGAASEEWFAKPPSLLAPAEAALLAALPRAPGRLNPLLHPREAKLARDEVLRRMARLGWLRPLDLEIALSSEMRLKRRDKPSAPHFAGWIRSKVPDVVRTGGRVVTTLDPAVQESAERILRRQVEQMRDRNLRGGAVVVLDVRKGELLALVGSPDFDSPDAGQVNAALARRQPGSAVKPFTYAVAFAGDLRPSTILADIPISYGNPDGVFTPRNYSGRHSGPVSARSALANSRNVPSIEVVERTGLARVARGFEQVGLGTVDIDRQGLGVTLGVGEVCLVDLAAAYACLARGGTWIEPIVLLEAYDDHGRLIPLPPSESHPALDPIASAWVNEILSDPAARAEAFGRGSPLELPGAVAAKTGTSSDWRDSWAILYSRNHVVAVWMGNPNGEPTDRVTGIEGAAMVASELLEMLEPDGGYEPFDAPDGIERRPICPLSGRPPGENCGHSDTTPFRVEDRPLPLCKIHTARSIDVVTGLLARSCTPSDRVRKRVFVDLPERFSFWGADRGLVEPPIVLTDCVCLSPFCREKDFSGGSADQEPADLLIVRPVHGTILAIDPTLPPAQQSLSLEADAASEVVIDWRIDGAPIGSTEGLHRLFWPITPGEHRIEAVASPTGEKSSVRILVLAAQGSDDADRSRASDPVSSTAQSRQGRSSELLENRTRW